MKRLKITIQYDGTEFHGWQLQDGKRTVQGVIEETLKNVFNHNKRISLYASGRTDTGVHSIGQVAHFDFKSKLDDDIIMRLINSRLPEDCQIMRVQTVSHAFHSRYDATKRLYKYQCYSGDSILYRNQSWIVNDLDISRLSMMAEIIKGQHDFLSFSKYNAMNNNTNCIIYDTEWKKVDQFICFFILGNRFLHHMVRYLVGTMVKTFHKNDFKKTLFDMLNKPSKSAYVHKAPPQGLFLENIYYED